MEKFPSGYLNATLLEPLIEGIKSSRVACPIKDMVCTYKST